MIITPFRYDKYLSPAVARHLSGMTVKTIRVFYRTKQNTPMLKSETKCEADHKSESPIAFSLEKVCRSSNLLKNLKEIVLSHPDKTAENLGMSIVYLFEDKYSELLECLETIAGANPEVSLIRRRIAEVFLGRNDLLQAITHLKQVVKLDREDQTALIWLALSYYEIGEKEKGALIFNKLRQSVFILHAENSLWV
jgi:tetratricopeptide (TPR) repeat protein